MTAKGAIRKRGGGGVGGGGVRQENMVGKRQQKEDGEVEQARRGVGARKAPGRASPGKTIRLPVSLRTFGIPTQVLSHSFPDTSGRRDVALLCN